MDLLYWKFHVLILLQALGDLSVEPLLCKGLFLPGCLLTHIGGSLLPSAEPTYLWVPVGHRWSLGAWPQSDPCRCGGLPQAGECPGAAAGTCGLRHECWQHLTTWQSPGVVIPPGLQGEVIARDMGA